MSHGHSHGGGEAHGHEHGHDHGHGHGVGALRSHNDLEQPLLSVKGESADGNKADLQKLKVAVCCALFFMLVEVVGGVIANSLAIITDAAHMLSDVGGFVVSIVALQLAATGATQEYTYGFKQAEVLGALLSIVIVWALTGVLLWEAVRRFMQPEEIDAPIMLTISVIGFLVNIVLMQVLGHGHAHGGDGGHGHSHGGGHGHSHSDNGDADHKERASVAVQAAVAHVIGDMVQSLGVCVASVCIWVKPFDLGETENGVSKWNYADPCCTVLFSILVLLTTKSTLVYTIDSLMVRAPKHVNKHKFVERLAKIPHVENVHDFHLWSLGSSNTLCTAHIMVTESAYATSALKAAIQVSQSFGVFHSTFQIEIVGEFDPALESYGGLHDNELSPRAPKDGSKTSEASSRSSQGHGHSHAGHEGSDAHGHSHDGGHGHSHDGSNGCCGGHSH